MHTKSPQPIQKETSQKTPRGGRGSKGNPLAIKYSIAEAVKDIQRTNHDLEKIQRNKEELLADLADLRIREREAEEDTLSERVKELIKKNIQDIQKKLNELNGILPEVNLSDDQKKIQRIINEWNEAKKEKRKALAARIKAEAILAEDPSNGKAMGQANRASATILSNTQEMEKVFHEAQIIKEKFEHDPVLDESVNIHTGEEEEKKRITLKESEIEHRGIKKESVPVRDEGISYTHKQSIIDRERYYATHKLTQEVPHTEKKGLKKIIEAPIKKKSEVVKKIEKKDIGRSAPLKEEENNYAEATKNLLLQMNRVLAKNKTINATSPKKRKDTPIFSLQPAEQHLLLNDKEHIPESRFTSLRNTLRTSFSPRTTERPTKEDRSPSFAEKTFLHHLNILFGKKGFLGFGARGGADSPHWKDPSDGFARKTIDDIFATHQDISQKDTPGYFGIKNNEATTKMKKYLSQAFQETKIVPSPKEMVRDYIVRVITTIFNNHKK